MLLSIERRVYSSIAVNLSRLLSRHLNRIDCVRRLEAKAFFPVFMNAIRKECVSFQLFS